MGKAKGGTAADTAPNSVALREELENLSCRFIVNLPANELASIERIGFQVEQAHWFYLDFLCPLNAKLPELNLRKFSEELLHTSSLVVPIIRLYMEKGPKSLELAYSQFLQYKTRVPVCGAILLNEDWSKCVLVKGWSKNASWTFPKGKINQDESQRDCALREVREETGVNASHLLPADSKDYLELTMHEQKIRLYIVPGVSETTPLVTQTRREISAQKPSAKLGGKFYLIIPFVSRLRQWIQTNKRTHPLKPPKPAQPATQPKPKEESVSLDALFGAPKPITSHIPGLIALPPSAQKQMEASRPQTPSHDAEEAAPNAPADNQSKLLLNLLHGSKPVPAPTSGVDHNRVDGSIALRNLLGLGNNQVTNTLRPPSTQGSISPQEHQAQLHSILSMPKQKPVQPQPASGHSNPDRHRMPTQTPRTADADGMPLRPESSMEERNAQPAQDEHRNRLLDLLGGPHQRPSPALPSAQTPSATPQPAPPSAAMSHAQHPFLHPFHAPHPNLPSFIPPFSQYRTQPAPVHPLPPHQQPRPPHVGHKVSVETTWQQSPAAPMQKSASGSQAQPSAHQNMLLSTLLGSSSRPLEPNASETGSLQQGSVPSPTQPQTANISNITPHTPSSSAASPSTNDHSSSLLGILNGPPPTSHPSTPNPSTTPSQAASNSLLVTLLGK